MEVYLVGGAVRDGLLGLPIRERDWVVVGATPEQLLTQDFQPVGKDFPVFLHPETREEYALARTERKTAPGYAGFVFHGGPEVTLEQDLARRDLTINAIAQAADGTLIDPFQGQEDLANGLLRHVSPAFVEDPVRVLRIARFAARFARFGFRVAHGTHRLLKEMVANGEVDALVPERVWREMAKALGEPNPERFFTVLRGCGALARVLPELDERFGPAPTGHGAPLADVLQPLCRAVAMAQPAIVRFACLWQNATRESVLQACARLKAPTEYRDLAVACAAHGPVAAQAKPEQFLEILEQTDAFRRGERFGQWLAACRCCYPEATSWDGLAFAREIAAKITAQPFVAQGLQGVDIQQALRAARRAAIVDGAN